VRPLNPNILDHPRKGVSTQRVIQANPHRRNARSRNRPSPLGQLGSDGWSVVSPYLTSAYVWKVGSVVAAIGNLILGGYLRTDKGADAALLTEIEENGSLLIHESDDVDRALPNARTTSDAFENINPRVHIEISFS
jgi:hypothetical protein